MKSTLILGAVAAAGVVAYAMHKPAAQSDWDSAIGAVASATDSSQIPGDVQAALNVLSQDAKAAGVSLDSTDSSISQKDAALDAEYLQAIGIGGTGAAVSLADMASVADALHAKGYFYECGMVLDAIAATYGPANTAAVGA